MPSGVYIRSEETKRILSEAHKGKPCSEETKNKLSELNRGRIGYNKGNSHTKEAKLKMSRAHNGHLTSEETRQRISRANTGKIRSDEMNEKNRTRHIGQSMSKDTRLKMSLAHKALWSDNSFAQRRFETLKMRPTKIELFVQSLLGDQLEYVGDGKCWINGKNPDFINYKKKLIIEVFGDYWHKKKG